MQRETVSLIEHKNLTLFNFRTRKMQQFGASDEKFNGTE